MRHFCYVLKDRDRHDSEDREFGHNQECYPVGPQVATSGWGPPLPMLQGPAIGGAPIGDPNVMGGFGFNPPVRCHGYLFPE